MTEQNLEAKFPSEIPIPGFDPQINYLALLPGDESPSPFTLLHGMSRTLLHRSGWIREVVANCPATAQEAFRFSVASMQLRLAGITYFRFLFLNACDLPTAR